MSSRPSSRRLSKALVRTRVAIWILVCLTLGFALLGLVRAPAARDPQARGQSRAESRADAPAHAPADAAAGEQTPPTRPTERDKPTADTGDTDADVATLARRRLEIPVDGVSRSALVPSFAQPRSDHPHEALDILAPRGTRVVAVDDGVIVKLFASKQGGLTIYHFDPSRRYAFYYAHLDRYADGLREGDRISRGDVIGYVGATGNASPDQPHLHFAIFKLGPEQRWWEGVAIDPYLVFVGDSGGFKS